MQKLAAKEANGSVPCRYAKVRLLMSLRARMTFWNKLLVGQAALQGGSMLRAKPCVKISWTALPYA